MNEVSEQYREILTGFVHWNLEKALYCTLGMAKDTARQWTDVRLSNFRPSVTDDRMLFDAEIALKYPIRDGSDTAPSTEDVLRVALDGNGGAPLTLTLDECDFEMDSYAFAPLVHQQTIELGKTINDRLFDIFKRSAIIPYGYSPIQAICANDPRDGSDIVEIHLTEGCSEDHTYEKMKRAALAITAAHRGLPPENRPKLVYDETALPYLKTMLSLR